MRYKELKKQAKQPDKYMFYGKEEYFVDDFLKFLKERLNPSFAEFNFISVEQDKTSYLETLAKIESVPMMDTEKIIYFPNFVTGQNAKNSWSKKEMEEFVVITQNLAENTWLVLKMAGEDRRNNISRSLEEVCQVCKMDHLNEAELSSYIKNYFKKKKLHVEESLVAKYSSMCGYIGKNQEKTLYDINGDLEKLTAFLMQNNKISDEDLDKLIGDNKEADIFQLVDFALQGDRKKALQLYQKLSGKDNSTKTVLSVFSLLSSNLSIYIKALYFLDKGYNQATIAKKLGIHAFRVKKALELKRYYTKQQALKKLELLNELDYKFKTGALPMFVLGELILYQIGEKG